MKKTIVAMHEGEELKVVNSWCGGLTLLHRGNIVASSKQLFALNKYQPIISTRIVDAQVEVFAYAPFFKVYLSININGEKIAGDYF